MTTLTTINNQGALPTGLEDATQTLAGGTGVTGPVGQLVGFTYANFLNGANESSDTTAIQIRTITAGKLFVSTASGWKEIVQGPSGTSDATHWYFDFAGYDAANNGPTVTNDGLNVRLTGVFIGNTKISGSDGKLYWSPTPGVQDFNGLTNAFTIRALSNVNGTYGETTGVGMDTISNANVQVQVNLLPANDTPSFTAVNGSVDEGGVFSSSVVSNASVGPANEAGQTITYSLVGSPTLNGGLQVSGVSIDSTTGVLTFTAVGDTHGSAVFTVKAMDSGGTQNGAIDFVTHDVTVTVNAVNDPVSNSVPGGQTAVGGIVTFAGATALTVSDADADESGGVTTTVSVNSGTLAVTAEGHGAVVTPNETNNSIVISGTTAQVNAALAGLTFTSGGDDATLTMTTTDNGNTGNGGPSTDISTVGIGVAPTITGVTIPDGAYSVGETIIVSVHFDHEVDVAGIGGSGALSIDLTLDGTGGSVRTASYLGGTGTDTLTFSYTVQAGENDVDGVAVGTTLNKTGLATVKSTTGSHNDASLTIGVLPEFADATVDTMVSTPTVSITETGASLSDGVTKIATITVGSLDADVATWRWSSDGGNNWTTVNPGSSASSFSLADGTYSANMIWVEQTDAAGNVSITGKNAAQVKIDTVVANPSPVLNTDTGVSGTDKVTFVSTVLVDNLEVGGTWEYSLNGGSTWSVGSSSSFNVVSGSNDVKVRQTDLAGNASSEVSFGTVVLDQIPPGAATATFVDTGMSSSDGVTNDNTVTVTLTGDAVSFEYTLNGGTNWTTVTGSGTFELGDNTPYTLGQVQVRQTDLAGNTGSAANVGAVTTDNIDPAAPTLEGPVDTAPIPVYEGSNEDGLTAGNTFSVGTADASPWKFQYSTDGGETWQDTDGTTFTVVDGTYESGDIQVLQLDVAGNDSVVTSYDFPITIDTVKPEVTIDAVTGDNDIGFDDYDAETGVTITGTINDPTVDIITIELSDYDFDGNTQFATIDYQNGTWSYTFEDVDLEAINDLANDDQDELDVDHTFTLTVKAYDDAGNEDVASIENLHIDLAPPPPDPTTIDLEDADDSGESSTDNITNINCVTIQGTAELGATVYLYDNNDSLVGSTTADEETGAYSFEVYAPCPGTFTYSTTQSVEDSQESEPTELTITFDFSPEEVEFEFNGASYNTGLNQIMLSGTGLLNLGNGVCDDGDITSQVNLSNLTWNLQPDNWCGEEFDLSCAIDSIMVLDDFTVVLNLSDWAACMLEENCYFGTNGNSGWSFIPDTITVDGAFTSVPDIAGNQYTWCGDDLTVTGSLNEYNVPLSFSLDVYDGGMLTNDTFGEDVSLGMDEYDCQPYLIDTTDEDNFSDMFVMGTAADLSIGVDNYNFWDCPPSVELNVWMAGVDDGEFVSESWVDDVYGPPQEEGGEPVLLQEGYWDYQQNFGTFDLVGGLGEGNVFDSRENGITFEDGSAVIIHVGGGDFRSLAGPGSNSLTLRGGRGDDQIQAADGGDRLLGNAGDDLLIGGSGGDAIYGGTGNDIIFGGGGNDYLSGGSGNDMFLFTGDGSCQSTSAVITDFNSSGHDGIRIADADCVDIINSGSDALIVINHGQQTIRVLGQNADSLGECVQWGEGVQFNIGGQTYGYMSDEKV